MAISDSVEALPTSLPIVIDLPVALTDELIAELCAHNPQYRFQTDADGRLVVTAGTGFLAAGGEAELVSQVKNWSDARDAGFVTSSSGYFRQLRDNAVKGPDCTYTSWESIEAQLPPDRKPQAYEKLAPDVTFELMSPADELKTLDAKCRGYINNGVTAVVLLISRDENVRLYRPDCEPITADDISRVLIEPDMLDFLLNARAVFDATKLRRRRARP